MDKTFSVEDLLGIWKSGGSTSNLLAASNSFGLGCRSTSDEAFQEFLKQIPSTSNFASIMEQHPESLPPSLPMAIPPLELAPPSTSASPSGDIPRVTSLEFLRPFTAPKVAAVGSGVVPDAAPATEPTPVGVVVPSSLGLPPMPQVSVCPPALPPGYAVLPQGAPIMLAPAVIPPPLQPPGSVVPPPAPMSATGTASETPHDEESMKKAELRRARRMLSNRESARRSRRRKQEHLTTLEEKIAEMDKVQQDLQKRLDAVQAQLLQSKADNARLREENNALCARCGITPTAARDVDAAPPTEEPVLRPTKRPRATPNSSKRGSKIDQEQPLVHQPAAAAAPKHSSDTSCKTEQTETAPTAPPAVPV